MSQFQDLFESQSVPRSGGSLEPSQAPLAVRMRPQKLDDIVGQNHLLDEGRLLKRSLKSGKWVSMILYGPPGSGKTTLANVISKVTHARFVPVNAVASNVSELRRIIEDSKKVLELRKQRTILFIDEIHRFNKAQQDILMPDVENGNLILIGATTHNPSFSINNPLLSRSLIFELRPLEERDLIQIAKRALKDKERGLGNIRIKMEDAALKHLAKQASGDARRILNALEVGVMTTPEDAGGLILFDQKVAEESCQRRIVYHDADEDYHYDIASAFIKSMRGSDPDAAVYWLAKMLYAGEDPRFIIRRILILASEDIGNADPQALILAASGLQAVEFVGMPEARIILGQLVTYMALAPKSNASYEAISKALQDVEKQEVQEVPNHLRDRSYQGAKKLDHGKGYLYSHHAAKTSDPELPVTGQSYTPKQAAYYAPKNSGFEKTLKERLQKIQELRSKTSK